MKILVMAAMVGKGRVYGDGPSSMGVGDIAAG